jgi:hypothetical protein
MRMSRMVYAMAAVVMGGMTFRCTTENSPTAPPDNVPGNVILSEGFEGDLSDYRQIMYTSGNGMMSLSTQHARFGKGSLTSDSNNTGIKKTFDPSIDDSIAGLQFHFMATRASHTNLLVALCKPGSSANGLFTIMGMGIGKSDSLQYVYEENPFDPAVRERRSFAALALNKWYKCKIEYNYADTTLTYSVDDAQVYRRGATSPMTLSIFVAMRDSLGAQGASGCYLDNVSVYKR